MDYPNKRIERMIDAEIDGDLHVFSSERDALDMWLFEGGAAPDWDRWNLEGLPRTKEAINMLRRWYQV